MPISDLVATVTQIRCLKQDVRIGVASGFFYTLADRLYLITNRHVVIKEDDDYFPDELQLRACLGIACQNGNLS